MATSVAAFLDRRIDPGTLPLAVGDVVVIAALLTLGTIMHNGVPFVTSNPAYLAGTIAPFFIGWIVAAPPIGAYSPGAGESSKASVPLAIRSWIVADVIGVGLRATPLFHGGGTLRTLAIFAGVTIVIGSVGLGVWRWLFFKVR
jgi:hypothetical protein